MATTTVLAVVVVVMMMTMLARVATVQLSLENGGVPKCEKNRPVVGDGGDGVGCPRRRG